MILFKDGLSFKVWVIQLKNSQDFLSIGHTVARRNYLSSRLESAIGSATSYFTVGNNNDYVKATIFHYSRARLFAYVLSNSQPWEVVPCSLSHSWLMEEPEFPLQLCLSLKSMFSLLC